MKDLEKDLLSKIYAESRKPDSSEHIKDLMTPKFKMTVDNHGTKIDSIVKLVNIYTTALTLQGTISSKPSKQHIICLAFYLNHDVINRQVRTDLAEFLGVGSKDINSFNRQLKLNKFLVSDKFKTGVYELSPELKTLQKFVRKAFDDNEGLNILVKISV